MVVKNSNSNVFLVAIISYSMREHIFSPYFSDGGVARSGGGAHPPPKPRETKAQYKNFSTLLKTHYWNLK